MVLKTLERPAADRKINMTIADISGMISMARHLCF